METKTGQKATQKSSQAGKTAQNQKTNQQASEAVEKRSSLTHFQLLTALGLIVFFTLFLRVRINAVNTANARNIEIEKEIARENEYRVGLEKDNAWLRSDEFFIKTARDRLGLVFDSDIVFIKNK